jgi:hypothetical protein
MKSLRSDVWTDTDPDRTGTLAWVYEEGFGFEKYAQYVLDVPMYFVYRDGRVGTFFVISHRRTFHRVIILRSKHIQLVTAGIVQPVYSYEATHLGKFLAEHVVHATNLTPPGGTALYLHLKHKSTTASMVHVTN